MIQRTFLLPALIFWLATGVSAQKVWTLQECIQRASERNLQVQRARLSAQMAEEFAVQSRLNLLPSLNGSLGYFFNFGKTIDPTTNQFVQQNIRTSSLSLSSGLTLIGGLQKLNTVRQSDFDAKAVAATAEQKLQDQTFLVLSAFLQVILAKENQSLAQQQLDLAQKQLERVERLVDAGSLTVAARYDAQAQRARQELLWVQRNNELQAARLNLAHLLDLTELPEVQMPDLTVPPAFDAINQTWTDIYEIALQRHPAVQAAMWQLRSAEAGLQVARGRLWPSISLFANISTNSSNLYRRFFIDSSSLNTQTIGFLATDFTPVINFFPSYSSREVGLFDQYADNFGQAVGISLDVPLFNNWQSRHQVSRSKLQVLDAQIQLEQARQQLRVEVQNAWHNAVAAKNQYEASLETLAAVQKSFEDAQRRLEAGAITSYDFFQLFSSFQQAQSEVLQRKYQYIFNLKVLDFYQGKPFTF